LAASLISNTEGNEIVDKASKSHSGIAARTGRWSAKHPRRAIVGWIVLVVLAAVIGGSIKTEKLSDTAQLDGDAARAGQILDRSGFARPAGEEVLVQSRGAGSVLGADGRGAIRAVVDRVSATGRVEDVRSPLLPANRRQVSPDRRSALVLFSVKGKADSADKRVGPVVRAVSDVASAHPQLRIAEFGQASATRSLNDTIGKDFQRAETLSIPLTMLILLVAFGALLAALVPVALALSAVIAATGLLGVTSHIWPIDGSASTVLLLIGLAVGVDYSLFYIRRSREERAGGHSAAESLEIAAATSGHSVFVSGLTVIVAMAGMFITGQGIFLGMAEATVLVVAVAIVGSLTVLPATLSLLSDRVERGRIPFFGKWLQRRREAGPSRAWSTVIGAVLRHPAMSAAIAAATLLVLAIPATRLHTAQLSASQELPRDLAVMKTYERIQRVFPGGPQPATIVVSANDVESPSVLAAIKQLRHRALASDQMSEPITVDANSTRSVAVVNVPLAGDGEDSVSARALTTLRERLIPATVGRVATVYVGGPTASSVDFVSQLNSRAPFVFLFVLGLAFALILWSFRSPVIAGTTIVLNLLSVAAAYGVLVAIFQWGWGSSLLGVTGTGAIASWLPLFLFVILFGLSMDYHVFSVSRIKEAHDRGMPTGRAIHDGIVRSAGVITSAALIMVFVFATFATLSQTSLKQLGVGLAVAVLLDATLVRTILLPATMALLGERNWYVPRRLRARLPRAAEHASAVANPWRRRGSRPSGTTRPWLG
jgi:uncharacterized membrane protein YdfJ with MMPL/SSD domain